MRLAFLLTTCFLLAVAPAGFLRAEEDAEPERIEAGDEDSLEIPGCDFPCHLYVPSDYQKGVRLPLIFFLHGSGGKPTSWPWKSATEGKGYFIVGLSYGAFPDGGQRGIQSGPESRTAMVKFIDKVRALVDEQYGIDQRRVFLSGLSMGGWGVNFYGFLDEARGRYRGYCIIAAGIVQSPPPDLSVLDGLPLMLLNGAKDQNLSAANRGAPLFEKAGAILEQVVLQDEGHVPGIAAMAPPLGAWLEKIEKEDQRRRALAAVKWKDVALEGEWPQAGRPAEEALLAWLTSRLFWEDVDATRPVLLFLTTDHTDRKGGASKQAQASERVKDEVFGYPVALEAPAAARPFVCLRAQVSSVDKKASPLLHNAVAPMVLLVGRDRKSLKVIEKGKLKDAALAKELRAFLTPEEMAAADARVETTKPILVEMRKLRSSIASEQKTLAKLRKKPEAKVRKKLEKHGAALESLQKRYTELHEKLAD